MYVEDRETERGRERDVAGHAMMNRRQRGDILWACLGLFPSLKLACCITEARFLNFRWAWWGEYFSM